MHLWLFFSQTVRALLDETIRAIPDSVLDSLPQLEPSSESFLADLGPLPLAPCVEPLHIRSHRISELPTTDFLVN